MNEMLIGWVLYICMTGPVPECPDYALAYMQDLDSMEECESYEAEARDIVSDIYAMCVYPNEIGI